MVELLLEGGDLALQVIYRVRLVADTFFGGSVGGAKSRDGIFQGGRAGCGGVFVADFVDVHPILVLCRWGGHGCVGDAYGLFPKNFEGGVVVAFRRSSLFPCLHLLWVEAAVLKYDDCSVEDLVFLEGMVGADGICVGEKKSMDEAVETITG